MDGMCKTVYMMFTSGWGNVWGKGVLGSYLAAGTGAWFAGRCGQGVSGSVARSCDSGLACCCCPQGWQTTGSTETTEHQLTSNMLYTVLVFPAR